MKPPFRAAQPCFKLGCKSFASQRYFKTLWHVLHKHMTLSTLQMAFKSTKNHLHDQWRDDESHSWPAAIIHWCLGADEGEEQDRAKVDKRSLVWLWPSQCLITKFWNCNSFVSARACSELLNDNPYAQWKHHSGLHSHAWNLGANLPHLKATSRHFGMLCASIWPSQLSK